MKKSVAIVLGLVLLVIFMLFSTTYTVGYYQVAVKTRFGKVDTGSVVQDAGLNFKLPFFMDRVYTFDTRVQVVETPKEEAATADGLQVVYQAYLLWRVDKEGEGPLQFYEAMDSLESASEEMRQRLVTKTASVLGSYDFDELIGQNSKLEEAEKAILAELQLEEGEGVLPISVGLSQILLPVQTTRAVLQRMQATRKAMTENENTKGQAERTRIEADGRTKSAKIIEFAEALAAQIEAEGDQQAAQYIEEMASKNERLAIFLYELETIKRTLNDNTTLILDTSLAPYYLMNLDSPLAQDGMPRLPGEDAATAAPGAVGAEDGEAEANDKDTGAETAADTEAGADNEGS